MLVTDKVPRRSAYYAVIDYFALALTHGLILIALIRLVGNKELDSDPEIEKRRYRRPKAADTASDSTTRAKGPNNA